MSYHPEYSAVDPKTGNVTYSGPLEITKGNHDHMPARTDAYLPGDERGHLTASSLSSFGGGNTTSNVVAQNRDVNHHGFIGLEKGERSALRNGADINSEKTAVVNGQPGDRPEAFMVSDTVTYADGHSETLHHSFTNESYANQQAWNDQSAVLPGTFDAPNPGDGLRDAMSPEAYADLMESTDAELPGIAADYAPADFSGVSDSVAEAGPAAGSASDSSAEANAGTSDADVGTDGGAGADTDPD